MCRKKRICAVGSFVPSEVIVCHGRQLFAVEANSFAIECECVCHESIYVP